MSYTINKSDGAILATLADGTINSTSTSLVLIGKNYAGYGVFLNENYVKLLENFAFSTAPSAPMTGQLWYDTTNKILKVYDAGITQWKSISTTTSSSSLPQNPVIGDLWWDTLSEQLNVWSGTQWKVVGPLMTTNTGQTGAIPETIQDTSGADQVVIKFYVQNTVVGILSRSATFTPQTAIAGFSTIRPGFNLVSATALAGSQFTGEVSSALTLQGLPSSAFLRKDIAETATLKFTAAGGLEVGAAGAGIDISNNIGNAEVRLTGLTNNNHLAFFVNSSGTQQPVLRLFGNVNSAFSGSLGVTGSLNVAQAIIGSSTLAITGNTNLTGQLNANTATFTGTTTFNGAAVHASTTALNGVTTVSANVNPNANDTIGLGSNALRYANVWATAFRGSTVDVTLVDSSNVVSTSAQLGNVQVTGTLGVGGNVQLNSRLTVSGLATFNSNVSVANLIVNGRLITPAVDLGVDLGSASQRFAAIYADTIYGSVSSNVSPSFPSITKIGPDGVGDIGSGANRYGNVYAITYWGTNYNGGSFTGTTGTFSGDLTAPALVKNGTNLVGNIGQIANRFNTVHAGTFNGNLSGNVSGIVGNFTGNVVAGGFVGTVFGNVSGNVSAASLTGSTLASSVVSSSLTSVGTLTSLAVSGTTTVNSSNNATAIANGGTAGVGNIGASGQGFNTIFAKATSAQYADLAERFAADDYYQPGTVVEIGGIKEITRAVKELSEAVFGVISTLPGFLMNDKVGSTEMNPPVAVNGRVPVRVIGKIRKGDRLVSAGNGLARTGSRNEITAFNVIGRALENKDTDGEGLIEAIVKLNS